MCRATREAPGQRNRATHTSQPSPSRLSAPHQNVKVSGTENPSDEDDNVGLASKHPALVIIDVQQAIDDPVWGPRNNPQAEDVIAGLLSCWRKSDLPIFHVRHDSLEDDSPYRPAHPGNSFKPQTAPQSGETVISKRTNSAFIDTDFAQVLNDSGCDGVVYCGVLTNNSLEATVRMSGNLGFPSYVVADACWSVDKVDRRGHHWSADDVHHLALANMDGEYATVVDSRDCL